MANLTVSVVVYRSKIDELLPLLNKLAANECIKRWVVVDNGKSDQIRTVVQKMKGTYICSGRNIGFGRGHNLALKHLTDANVPYHLILNPDISFEGNALETLAGVMDASPHLGLIMPKVVYPDGSIQYLCKLLPAPIDLVLRRFAPRFIKRLARKRIAAFELQGFNYAEAVSVPSLSGCFMFVRRAVLDVVGGFDARFFLYMEDVDLCRRIAAVSELLYCPEVTVTHQHQKASYKNIRVLLMHLVSAMKYFNKWGWIVDPRRKKVNQATLAYLRSKGYEV